MSNKRYETEWEFSFEDMAQRIRDRFQAANGDPDDDDERLEDRHFAVPLADAAQAVVSLQAGVATLKITALDHDSDKLFEADLINSLEVDFSTTGETERHIKLVEKTGVPRIGSQRPTWHVRLHPSVTLTLTIRMGAGEAQVMLTGLAVDYLSFTGGAGETHITLPQQKHARALTAQVRSGLGETHVNVPPRTAAFIDLRGGMGETCVSVPPASALSVQGRIGIGSINLDPALIPVSQQRLLFAHKGLWMTDGFDEADHQIQVDFRGGVGKLRVETPQIV